MQTYSSTSLKAKLALFSLVAILALTGCNGKKQNEVAEETHENPLAVPYSLGPSTPPEVNIPTSNPPTE